MAKRTPPPPMPEFTSDRLRMLAPAISTTILDMARNRIVTGESFFSYDKLREGLEKADVKLALIIVLEMNPREDLDANEQATLRGMTRKVYVEQSQAGELVR